MRTRVLSLLLLVLVLTGCSLAGVETPAPALPTARPSETLASPPPTEPPVVLPSLAPPVEQPDPHAGSGIFAEKCAPCHGLDGLGDGPQAANLPNPAARLGDPAVARRARPSTWYEMVTVGNLERFMPGFASLSDGERWSVVAYSLGLSVPQGALERGEATYREFCLECHGLGGKGTGGGPDFSEPAFMTESSLEELFAAIGKGAGQKMPAFAGSLSEDERWSVASYVRALAYKPSTGEQAEPSPAPEETTGSLKRIVGQVVNGTLGGVVPPSLEVTLLVLDNEDQVESRTTMVGQEGSFVFEDVEAEAGRLFAVTVRHEGVDYTSQVAHLLEEDDELDLPVRIYDATQETVTIRADRLHILFDFAVPDRIQVIELWVLSNLGDRAIADEDGKGILGMMLPEGASDVRFDEDLAAEGRFAIGDGGFVDTQPLLPGQGASQVVFSFDLPYDRKLEFVQPVNIPVEAVVLFMPEKGPSLKADGLQDMGVQQLSGRSLSTSALGAIAADGEIRLAIAGRPQAVGTGTSTISFSNLAIGLAALGLAVLGVGVWWFQPLRRWQVKRTERASASVDERDRLLQVIADLDDEFEAGNLKAAEYRERRDDLKRRIPSSMKRPND